MRGSTAARFTLRLAGAIAVCLAVTTTPTGCSLMKTGGGPKFIESGFLTEYSVLQPGREDQLALVYIHPGIDFGAYSKILFEPITIWLDDTQSEDIESDDLQRIADGLYFAVATELREDWELATESGQGVMRLRIGLIAIDDADDQLDVYTTMAAHETAESPERIPDALRGIGEHVTVEIELFDDRTREVLAAAMDRWADTGEHSGPVDTWADVHREFSTWGRWLRGRLAVARERATEPGA